MARNLIVFAISFLIYASPFVALALTNFNHNPNCLLMSGLEREAQVSDYTFPNLKMQYENHISFAHQSGLVVKYLNSNSSVSFIIWKTCCIEMVIFYEGGDLNSFHNDVATWGYHSNAVQYIIFSRNSYQVWRDIYSWYWMRFYAPIYLIRVEFERNLMFTQLLNPINSLREVTWNIFPIEDSAGQPASIFPTGDLLIKSRQVLNYNQNLFRLQITSDWVYPLKNFDCENHRYFLSTGPDCFVAFGPLQAVQRTLNLTFSSYRWGN